MDMGNGEIIKELATENADLKHENAELKARIEKLEKALMETTAELVKLLEKEK